MKDPKDAIRDLENACNIRPKEALHRNGSCDWQLTTGMWSFVWNTMNNAREVITYLLRERDSLLELLSENGGQ